MLAWIFIARTTTFCAIDDEGQVCKRGKVESSESQCLRWWAIGRARK